LVLKKTSTPNCNIARHCVSRRRVAYSIAINTCAAIIFQRTTQPGIDIPGYRALTPDGVMGSAAGCALVNDGGSAASGGGMVQAVGLPGLVARGKAHGTGAATLGMGVPVRRVAARDTRAPGYGTNPPRNQSNESKMASSAFPKN